MLDLSMCPHRVRSTMGATPMKDEHNTKYYYCMWSRKNGTTAHTRVYETHPRAIMKRLKSGE